MTRRVLILTIIAMFTLGVMAVADVHYTAYGSTYNNGQQATISGTCVEDALQVTSAIGIEQGYVATATSYDASFCGAPCACECANGPSLTRRLLSSTTAIENGVNEGILISRLTVKSNGSPIMVHFSITQPISKNDPNEALPVTYYVFYNNGTAVPNTNPPLELTNGSHSGSGFYGTPLTGTLEATLTSVNATTAMGSFDVVLDTTSTTWGESVSPIGQYEITSVFTICPVKTY